VKALEKRHCKRTWDALSAEYYIERHKTSRNFDRIIDNYLPKMVSNLIPGGLYLDVGAGKGRLQELYKNRDFEIIVGDFSIPMMKLNSNQLDKQYRIQMDAFNLPFRSGIFDGVFSLLGDSYALREAFEEVYRVLNSKGLFALTLPTKVWRENLISALGNREDETIFELRDGTEVKVPSFLYDLQDLERVLIDSGFEKAKVGEWKSLNLIERDDFSQHVLISAHNLGILPEDLPLITYAIAFKNPKLNKY